MQTMNISLPDSMKHFIDAQVTTGGYSSVSEYIRALVREAQQRQEKTRQEALLLQVLESGSATAMLQQDWETIRQEGLARVRARATSQRTGMPLSRAQT